MKKLILFLCTLIAALSLSACDVSGVALFYTDTAETDGFTYGINETANCCYVSAYECEEYTENMEITIPDEYDGVPITRLGGYLGRGYPMPFYVAVYNYMNAPENSDYAGVFGDISGFEIDDEYTIVELPFVLNIGKNISTIEYVNMDNYYPHINDDGTITFYHPVVEVVCSEENNSFYSKDGKLYNKDTDELITDFEYKSEVD